MVSCGGGVDGTQTGYEGPKPPPAGDTERPCPRLPWLLMPYPGPRGAQGLGEGKEAFLLPKETAII